MSIWGDLLLMYVLNVCWLGFVNAALCWLAMRWLRGFHSSAVCWVWRAGILATVLLPVFAIVMERHGGVPVADGTSRGNVWTNLALFIAAFIAWRTVRLFINWIAVRRLRRGTSHQPLQPWALAVIDNAATRFRGPRPAVLAGANKAAYTAGWHQPILVLPERYFGPEEIPGMASIVGHELAHIERHDYAWNLLLEGLCVLAAYHPAVAWMKRAADLAREQACDELVVQRMVPAAEYAGHLLEFAQATWNEAVPAHAMTVVDNASLETRLRSLLQPSPIASLQRIVGQAIAAVVLLAILAAYIPPRVLYVDFAPRPEPPVKFGGRWTWAPPPPPPPPR